MSVAGRDGTDDVDKLAKDRVYILNLLCKEISKIIGKLNSLALGKRYVILLGVVESVCTWLKYKFGFTYLGMPFLKQLVVYIYLPLRSQ